MLSNDEVHNKNGFYKRELKQNTNMPTERKGTGFLTTGLICSLLKVTIFTAVENTVLLQIRVNIIILIGDGSGTFFIPANFSR